MKVEIIQGGTVLRQYKHDGRLFAEAPPEGAYEIRVTNDSYGGRRLAVVSVDGVNVVTGEDGSVDGAGYVLGPMSSITIPGWRRDGEKVAKFTFQASENSYANRTGRGTKNTGIIGVAVFDEKPNPFPNILRSRGGSFNSPDYGEATMDSMPIGNTLHSSNAAHDGSEPQMSTTASSVQPERYTGLGNATKKAVGQKVVRRRRQTKSAEPVSLGTGYGKETAFHTETTTFNRVREQPTETIAVQYAVREMLVQWGISVIVDPPKPEAFPASVPPPPGWQANR